MKQFIKISKKVLELNDSEAYVYMRLVLSKLEKRKISRKYLAVCLGVSNLDYISQIVASLENKGLISRPVKRHQDYRKFLFDVINSSNWFKLDVNVARAFKNSRAIGFALRYRCLAFDDSLDVKYTKLEIANKMGISRPTLNKNLKLIETENLTPKDLYTDNSGLTNENKTELNEMLTFPKNTKVYKLADWFIENKLDEQKNSNDMFLYLQSGVLKKKSYDKLKDELAFNFI